MRSMMFRANNLFQSCMIAFMLILYSASASFCDSTKYYSFEFKDCKASDAISEISKKSGVKINAPLDTFENKAFNKSYVDFSIDQIIQDIFRGDDYAIIWNYKNSQLVSIEIRLAEKGNSNLIKNPTYDSSIDNIKNKDIFVKSKKNNVSKHQKNISVNSSENHFLTAPPTPDSTKFKGLALPPVPPGLPTMDLK